MHRMEDGVWLPTMKNILFQNVSVLRLKTPALTTWLHDIKEAELRNEEKLTLDDAL